ncbi:MAG: uracil-DNA glycosylase [Rhizobiaceae bacterium]|nr:uracil-DNA glycosylase [Rhizobiaceae bacterium]
MPNQVPIDPDYNCKECPRLRQFILDARSANPDWYNGPVPTFYPENGKDSVELLIVGLAPGMRGANRTSRPFTGDYAGDLLYATLTKYGFATGQYDARPDDSIKLEKTAITNAVRCVPPENKPVGAEINTCRKYLISTFEHLPNLKAIVTLGKISHDSTVRTLNAKVSQHPFGHNTPTKIDDYMIFPSYHCSRYNTNTGRLTTEMFEDVFDKVKAYIST